MIKFEKSDILDAHQDNDVLHMQVKPPFSCSNAGWLLGEEFEFGGHVFLVEQAIADHEKISVIATRSQRDRLLTKLDERVKRIFDEEDGMGAQGPIPLTYRNARQLTRAILETVMDWANQDNPHHMVGMAKKVLRANRDEVGFQTGQDIEAIKSALVQKSY